jgi:hypothetical protein
MKPNYTDIIIVLDRSGSMQSVMHDTIGGFNHFLQSQQEAPGEATITLIQFDDQYEGVYRGLAIKDAEPLTPATFVPRGSTALLDAIGRTIEETGARLAALDESERPEKVLFVIVTDGFENASRKYTRDQVNDLIAQQRDTYKWEFVFLGANQDAISTASSMGIGAANALTYAANSGGVRAAMASLSKNAVSYRVGATMDASFTSEDRDEQRKAGA